MNGGLDGACDLRWVASGTDHELREEHGRLEIVDEDGGARRRLQVVLARVGDDADNFGRIPEFGSPADIQLLPNRLPPEPLQKLSRELLVHHNDAGRIKRVAGIEVASGEQRRSHGLEIPGTDHQEIRVRRSGRRWRTLLRQVEAGSRIVFFERQEMRGARFAHAGRRPNLVEDAREVAGSLARLKKEKAAQKAQVSEEITK